MTVRTHLHAAGSDFQIRDTRDLEDAGARGQSDAAVDAKRREACQRWPPPWETWAADAALEGVEASLVRRGRALIRAFYTGELPTALASYCGYEDGGVEMLRLARQRPRVAEAQWSTILTSHGQLVWCEVPARPAEEHRARS